MNASHGKKTSVSLGSYSSSSSSEILVVHNHAWKWHTICGGDDLNLLLTCKIWLTAVSLQLPSFWALSLIGSCNTQCPNLFRWLGAVKMLFTSFFFLYEEWSGRCDLFCFQEFVYPGILIGSCERNGIGVCLVCCFYLPLSTHHSWVRIAKGTTDEPLQISSNTMLK